MNSIGMPELIVLLVIFAILALGVVGIVLLIWFLQKRDRRVGTGQAPVPPRLPPEN